MKKMIVLMLGIAMIFLTGCKKEPKPMPIQKDFTATVKCGDEQYTVTHNGKSITNIVYEVPEELQGLSYNYKGSQLNIKYGELTYTPSGEIPQNNVSVLHNVLCSISEKTEENIKTCDFDHTVYETRTANITCSTESGKIEKISIKNDIKIYEFSINEN